MNKRRGKKKGHKQQRKITDIIVRKIEGNYYLYLYINKTGLSKPIIISNNAEKVGNIFMDRCKRHNIVPKVEYINLFKNEEN